MCSYVCYYVCSCVCSCVCSISKRQNLVQPFEIGNYYLHMEIIIDMEIIIYMWKLWFTWLQEEERDQILRKQV